MPSPVQHENDALTSLEEQLAAANRTKNQLEDDLNSFRENQMLAIEETRIEVTRAYQTQVASLQQSLIESEYSMQKLEKQLADIRSDHNSEIESILKQQEAARASALQERDQKHAKHILRLTAELSAQQEFVDAGKRDFDEEEAERIQLIKQSMKELHEKEKTKMTQEHENEKLKLIKEFQHQMENSTQQMEQVANAKIEEMHGQFMSAHQSILEQKNVAESNLEHFKIQLQQTAVKLAALETEKNSLEEQYHMLLESHSAEVEEMTMNACNLEERVKTWKEKAANLESRLELSGETQESVHHLKEQYEAILQTVTKEQVASLESVLEQHTKQNALLQEQLQSAEEAQFHYQEELEQLKSQHGSEVHLLEKSISESLSDKASLEAAEEHMSSIQKQLKAYRMQESNMNAEMTKLKKEEVLVVELLKERHEQEKSQELDLLCTQFTTEIKELKLKLAAAQTGQVDETKSADSHQELHFQHQMELAQLKKDLHEIHTLALAKLQSELENDHKRSVEGLKQQHQTELDQLNKLTAKQLADNEAVYEMKLMELKESHDVEITKLKQLSEYLQQTLEQRESVALDKLNSEIATLRSELQTLLDEKTDWLEMRGDLMSELERSQREIGEGQNLIAQASTTEIQLREQCQEFTSRIQSLESDCHIAQSSSAHMKQLLDKTETRVKELTSEIGELQNNMEAVESASQEQAQKLLHVTDQLAERNVTIADLQSQNGTLNTEIFSLTQMCQQRVSSIEMLQRQLENSGAVSEEITALQQQLSELAPVKEQHAQLKNTLAQFEATIKTKDDEIKVLQTELNQLHQQLSEMTSIKEHHAQLMHSLAQFETTVQAKDEEVRVSQTKLQQQQERVDYLELVVQSKEGELAQFHDYNQIKKEVDQLRVTIKSKDSEINSLCGDLDHADVQMRELKAQLEAKLQEVTLNSAREMEANNSYTLKENNLRQQVEQKTMLYAQLESNYNALQEEFASAKEELNRLQRQLQESMTASSDLKEANESLSVELKEFQEQSLSVQNDSLMELRSRYDELEQSFTTLSSEKERLAAELVRVQEEEDRRVKECTTLLEVKVQELEVKVEDLHSQLNLKEIAFVEMQSQFNQKLSEATEREPSLRQSLDSLRLQPCENIGLAMGQKSSLEVNLSRARRRLTEKLQEKETLEEDLSFHRTELERRLGEKQRLEGLLFEKSRFEQELMNQKKQLQSDLLQIESKLNLQVGRVGQQHMNHIVTVPNQHTMLTHS